MMAATRKPLLHFSLRYAGLVALLVFASLAHAASLSPISRAEVDSLLSRLAASGCRFERNETWYSAEEAQAHLRKKLDYLVGKGAVASAEQFIERAASRSSLSGRAYQVQCGTAPPAPSGTWLFAELQSLRAASAAARPPLR